MKTIIILVASLVVMMAYASIAQVSNLATQKWDSNALVGFVFTSEEDGVYECYKFTSNSYVEVNIKTDYSLLNSLFNWEINPASRELIVSYGEDKFVFELEKIVGDRFFVKMNGNPVVFTRTKGVVIDYSRKWYKRESVIKAARIVLYIIGGIWAFVLALAFSIILISHAYFCIQKIRRQSRE